jgi:hypothetical protein
MLKAGRVMLSLVVLPWPDRIAGRLRRWMVHLPYGKGPVAAVWTWRMLCANRSTLAADALAEQCGWMW